MKLLTDITQNCYYFHKKYHKIVAEYDVERYSQFEQM